MAGILTTLDFSKLLRAKTGVNILQGAINAQGVAAFKAGRIPGASLFDVSVCSDTNSPFIYTVPSKELFENYVRQLGIRKTSHVVIYDAITPVIAAPRIWWMFRLFGHEKVSVLSGGLHCWREEGREIELDSREKVDQAIHSKGTDDGDFVAVLRPNLIKFLDDVNKNLGENEFQLIDGRPRGMYDARSIPGASNIPFPDVVDDEKRFKTKEDLMKLFENAGINVELPTMAYCLTGVTACSLALAAHVCGNNEVAVYDGSWNEWKANLSVENKMA